MILLKLTKMECSETILKKISEIGVTVTILQQNPFVFASPVFGFIKHALLLLISLLNAYFSEKGICVDNHFKLLLLVALRKKVSFCGFDYPPRARYDSNDGS